MYQPSPMMYGMSGREEEGMSGMAKLAICCLCLVVCCGALGTAAYFLRENIAQLFGYKTWNELAVDKGWVEKTTSTPPVTTT